MNKIFSDSIIYFLAQIINRLLPFLLLPILTRYLSPEQYGVVTSFTVVLGLAAVFVGLSTNGAVNVNYFQRTHEEMRSYVFMALVVLFISLLLSITAVHLFSTYLYSIAHLSEPWLLLALTTAFFQFITLINLALWQAEQKAKLYGIYEILQTLLLSLLTLLFVIALTLQAKGVIFATAIAQISFGVFSLYFLWKRDYIHIMIDKNAMLDLAKFGIPMIPHQLSGWIFTQYDKLFVLSMLGLSAAGIYTIGFQFGAIISILTLAFNKAWSPFLFKKLSSNPDMAVKIQLVKYTYLYFIAIIILASLLTFVAPFILQWYVGAAYQNASAFVGIITFAFAFNGMYFMVVNYLFYTKKTHILALITFSNSLFYIMTSYILLKQFGAIGVAYATLLSYILLFIAVWVASEKIHPMPWCFWRYTDV